MGALLRAAAVFALAVLSSTAQTNSEPPGGRTLWVAARVARSCNGPVRDAAIQSAVEAQLREAGIAVSRVHTAVLSADVDCAWVTAGRTTTISVHQCLDLSQPVSIPAEGRRETLASTWRKCQSYTCTRTQCGTAALSQSRKLVEAFVADSPGPKLAAVLSPRPPAPAPPPAEAAIYTPPTTLVRTAVASYYVIYIAACLTLLVRRRFLKPRFR